ncbi:HAD family hydrolase [Candidatus Methylopumilus universalis]|uniref:HAD family hydrolase n=1 Tax=Candidatus Methylopumilus universalis TaxID=2588536 RepID=A0AAX1F118_9PROT|nr:HAD family hydrolase [Candidatus Methylopumilus universalis]QDC41444.1 HAD family hydrolase [Candidatus Methylopumilus universalis]QDC42725.1 HAD family hydrolase [Candidatus Methylopumilus universalis]QDC55113.1 HAD family hydrolase [Candidatus Methylopumilus universalis]QDC56393.1 HAD family hydrolase [Candidatus Methylopumilus universalis]QDC57683.1 HAD family hydrolase [Candidatus Methylopumilus universalis]
MNLALFDLDNTILAGDSDYNWSRFLIQEGYLDGAIHAEKNEKFYADYKAGTLDIYAFVEFQFKPLARNPRAVLNQLLKKYVEEVIKPMITEKARVLVKRHQEEGDLIIVITATNSFITKPIAELFGIENLIGTDPEEKEGEFTGKVSGLPSFKEGKVTRLEAWLKGKNLSLASFEKSYFYSDSHNDLPLMQKVTHPVAVDSDDVLSEYAKSKGWPQISLR